MKVFIQGQTADIERLERLDGSTLTNNMGGVPLEQIELDVQITKERCARLAVLEGDHNVEVPIHKL